MGAPKPSGTTVENQGGTKTVDNLSWAAARLADIDLSGLGFAGKPVMTGEQAFVAFQKLAKTDPGRWSQIRFLLLNMHAYSGTKMPNFEANWTSADEYAIKNAITEYHIDNMPNPTDPVPTNLGRAVGLGYDVKKMLGNDGPKPFLNFAMATADSVGKNGYKPDVVKTPHYAVPATADLQEVAKQQFLKANGRYPTSAESSDFAAKFQALALSYGKGQNNPSLQTAFSAPDPASVGLPASPVATPATPAGQVMEPPSAGVAATNFALKAHPNQAASNGMNDAISTWLNNLSKGAGTNGN